MADYVPTKAEIDACVALATATADADIPSFFRSELTDAEILTGVIEVLTCAGNARAGLPYTPPQT
jgi:hypothetical protein